MEPILTGSPMLAGNRPTLCTGNDYLSLTDIDPHDGSLHGICFLHEGLRGTVELIGNGALACPWVEADGRELPLGGNLRWERLEHWIPSFSWRGDGLAVRGVICCP
ncbi:MAG: hypothetical protein HYY09_02735, partial [Firmicutes bacterium]|nr:hypothetical protein [Bacillota bacterium]